MPDDSSPDSEESQPRLEGARQLLSAGGLLLAVLLVLALGAALRVDPSQVRAPEAKPAPSEAAAETPSSTSPEASSMPGETPLSPSDLAKAPETTDTAPEAAPANREEAPAPDDATGLSARAEGDAASLSRSDGSFTLQLLYACRDETVERFLKRAPGSSALRVLPAAGKPGCYRVCWGSYASSQEAQSAVASIPARVREGIEPRPAKLLGLLR